MKTSINLLLWTTRVTDALLPAIEGIRTAGYAGVEVPVHDNDPARYASLGRRLDDLGLGRTTSTALPGPGANLIGEDPASRLAAVDYLRGVIDSAHALGSPLLIGPVYQALGEFTGRPPTEDEFERAADGLRRVARHAGAAGVTVCLEPLNRFECHLVNTVAAAVGLARRTGEPNVKVMLDTFHANIEETDVAAVIERHRDWIHHVHISENHRGAPGDGHLPLAGTIDRFVRGGYSGWFVVEAFGTALPELAAATCCWRPTFESECDVVEAGARLFRTAAAGHASPPTGS